jgi:hypothetical protein
MPTKVSARRSHRRQVGRRGGKARRVSGHTIHIADPRVIRVVVHASHSVGEYHWFPGSMDLAKVNRRASSMAVDLVDDPGEDASLVLVQRWACRLRQ